MSVSFGRYEYSFILLCLSFKCCDVFRRRCALVCMRERWNPLQSYLEIGWQAARFSSNEFYRNSVNWTPALSHQHLWQISPWHCQLRTASRMMLMLTMITESIHLPRSTEYNNFVGSMFLCILKCSQRVWRGMVDIPVLWKDDRPWISSWWRLEWWRGKVLNLARYGSRASLAPEKKSRTLM